jgi:hypothetical protein
LSLAGPTGCLQLGQGFLERCFQFCDALFQSGILSTQLFIFGEQFFVGHAFSIHLTDPSCLTDECLSTTATPTNVRRFVYECNTLSYSVNKYFDIFVLITRGLIRGRRGRSISQSAITASKYSTFAP